MSQLAAALAPQRNDFDNVRIEDVQSMTFRYRSRVGVDDEESHQHPAPEHDAVQRLTRIRTNVGIDGYCFGGSNETTVVARRLLVGWHPLDREALHTR
ncbi:MAG: hypothetical protein LC797_23980, partial [Chloroflexi bacterium]|nr:hypothetical protein [Chloroflexota bacterium]